MHLSEGDGAAGLGRANAAIRIEGVLRMDAPAR